MFSGVLVFALGQHKLPPAAYKLQPQKLKISLLYLGIIVSMPLMLELFQYNIKGLLLVLVSFGILVYLGYLRHKQTAQERRNIINILFILLIVIIFTMFLGQGGATLNLFIDRIIDRHFFGFIIPTAEFYALDPLFMLTIGPLVIALFAILSKKRQSALTYTKLTMALGCLGFGFLIFLLAANHARVSGHASALYIVIAYCIFPIAELLLFPTVLAAITKYSPKNLNSMMMGVFMLSQAIAAFFMGQIAKLGKVDFALSNLIQLKHAANIYTHFFTVATITLLFCTVVILVARFGLHAFLRQRNLINL